MADKRGEYRKPRLFTFNALDEDVTVNLEFSIPFLKIPAKRAVQSTGLWSGSFPSLNINPAALAVGGAVVFGASVALPLLLKKYALQYPQQRYAKILDSTEFSTDAILHFASELLSDNNSVRGCALRIACWTAQETIADTPRVWNQVMSNPFLTSLINATAIEDAMLSGKKGRECETYTPCPLRQEHLPTLINNVAALTGSVESVRY
ncbi:uncharacterized protein LOC113240244 [Hyposmocoma kahamanoa]|uniref:uncharacterized protein LOC113240244 n=1 Tax=Hyposmocoma kahamanoa TaxID=1477025 RepID=UPI000E6D9BCD|nr:uncharacterized protein LOC113240244 [Hyposmocoma kahamanoa]